MKRLAVVLALLLAGASGFACDGLLGISVIDRAAPEDASNGWAGSFDAGNEAELDSAADAAADASADVDLESGTSADVGAAPACVLSALTLSSGTLTPAFQTNVLTYAVVASATTLGVPFTVTPTLPAGCAVTVNGAAVTPGEASSPIALGLLSPTAIDVEIASRDGAARTHYGLVVPPVQEAYVKASDTRAEAYFGIAVAMSSDGSTLAVAASGESNAAVGSDGDGGGAPASDVFAAYVFVRTGTTWTQQAYVTASNPNAYAFFGSTLALSADGNTLAVGSPYESGDASGVDSEENDAAAEAASGAVYVFGRTAATWTQQAYVKASNTRAGAHFGSAIALSSDGNTLAVGSPDEEGGAQGIDGDESPLLASAGAVYVFARTPATWTQQAYVKASNTQAGGWFGATVAVSSDGSTLAVGSSRESSAATGVGGNQSDTSDPAAGAVYVFARTGTTWAQQAYVKASNTSANAMFGYGVALTADGNTLAASALTNTAYFFVREGTVWAHQTDLAAGGAVISLSADGKTLAAGLSSESSAATGINGNPSAPPQAFANAGAAYVFARAGTAWVKHAYVKASNTLANASFGISVALSSDGNTLAVGSSGESSAATGINGNETASPKTEANSGAVYVYR